MTRPENITATIIATKNIFNAVLDENVDYSDWERNFRGLTWSRQRKYRANRVIPAVYQAAVAPQKQPLEWQGPTFILGEEKGTVRQRLALTQTETRERSMFSRNVGRLVGKSWHLKVASEICDAPKQIEIRDLTAEEREEHAQLGGSRETEVVVDTGPVIDLVIGYDHAWFIREQGVDSTRLDPHSQIGQMVLTSLHQTSQQLFLPGSA